MAAAIACVSVMISHGTRYQSFGTAPPSRPLSSSLSKEIQSRHIPLFLVISFNDEASSRWIALNRGRTKSLLERVISRPTAYSMMIRDMANMDDNPTALCSRHSAKNTVRVYPSLCVSPTAVMDWQITSHKTWPAEVSISVVGKGRAPCFPQ